MQQPTPNFTLVKSNDSSLVAPKYCNNFYEELEDCQGLISNNWGLAHHKKIYDVRGALKAINEEASIRTLLHDIIKPNQTIYYAGQIDDVSDLELATLIDEIKRVRKEQASTEPFVMLFSRSDDFKTLKAVWARSYTFTETVSRFLAAWAARIFSKSAWLSPSTGVIIGLLTAGAGILLSFVLPNINQTIIKVFMGVACAGLLFAVPLFFRFVYRDYRKCSKAHKNPIFYNFFDYLGDISPRLHQWANKNFFQSVIVGVGVVGSLIALFLTIAFYTSGFGIFPDSFGFMNHLFSFSQTLMPIVFPDGFLPIHLASMVGAIVYSAAFIITPFFTAISIQRFVSTLIEAGDRSTDPYYQDEPKGERKLLSEPYSWQTQSYTLVLDAVDNSSRDSKQYNDSEKPATVTPLY